MLPIDPPFYTIMFFTRNSREENQYLGFSFYLHSSLQMTRAMTAQGEKESHWMRLIDLEGDTNFTLQNQSAVKGQKLGLCLQSLIFLSPRHVSPFSRGVIFTRALVSLAQLSLRKNGDYSQSVLIKTSSSALRSSSVDR